MTLIAQFSIPTKEAMRLFNTMIRPIAMYNTENLVYLTEHQLGSLNENKNIEVHLKYNSRQLSNI